MAGLLVPSLVAFGLAVARGGSISNWSRTRVLGWQLVVGVFAFELVLYNPPVDREPWAMWIGPWLWLATRPLLLGVLIVNAYWGRQALWAWRLAAVGMLLNTLVIAANGGHMPQSTEAATAVWGASSSRTAVLDNTVEMTAGSALAPLGDVIAEPRWFPRANVVSVGDILLALGVAAWVFAASTRPQRRSSGAMIGMIGSPVDGAARPDRLCSL